LESGKNLDDVFKDVQGILIPGGFGARGTEGKIRAIEYARTKKVPMFGICLGLQLSVIEFARHVCGIDRATSEEFESGGEHLIHYMDGQSKDGRKGGNMRLGSYDCSLEKGSLARTIYGKDKITERHRHRLEVNNFYLNKLVEKGLVVSGFNTDLNLVKL
jgi:CTP synthase